MLSLEKADSQTTLPQQLCTEEYLGGHFSNAEVGSSAARAEQLQIQRHLLDDTIIYPKYILYCSIMYSTIPQLHFTLDFGPGRISKLTATTRTVYRRNLR